MSTHSRKSGRAAKQGLAPGSLVYVGEPASREVHATVFDFSTDTMQESMGVTPERLRELAETNSVTWVNVDGVHDVDAVRTLCEALGVHPLAIEDVVNPSTRAKAEDYGEVVFVVAKMARHQGGGFEQISVLLGPTWVLSFQEHAGDLFEPIRRRIRAGTGRIRVMGADYLLHALLDAIVDGHFLEIERLEDHISDLEERAADERGPEIVRRVHEIRSEISAFKRLVWPLREVLAELLRSTGRRIHEDTVPFFRDLHDHVLQVVDALDADRDRLTAALELHLAFTSHRMNEVMGLLTVIASVFIPLTFIAGVYGMNFEHMPELHWRYGYAGVWVLMIFMSVAMLAWFRRRGWL